MRYLMAIILPPVGVLLTGRYIVFLFNLLLCLCLWIPGIIHALFIVHQYETKQTLIEVQKELNNAT